MNKFKVRYHFEAPNKVIASIEDCQLDAFEYFNNHFIMPTSSMFEIWGNNMSDDRYIMPDSFEATAYCSPDDEFNWEEGKKIAFNRLCDKYTESLKKHVKNIQLLWERVSYQWANITYWDGN